MGKTAGPHDVAGRYEGRATIPRPLAPEELAARGHAHTQPERIPTRDDTSGQPAKSSQHAASAQSPTSEERATSAQHASGNQHIVDGTTVGASRSAAAEVYARKRKNIAYTLQHMFHPRVLLGTTVAIVLIALVVAYNSFVSQRALAQQDAHEILASFSALTEQVRTENMDGAAESARTISSKADSLEALTSSGLWNVAAVLPGIGDDVACLRGLSSTLGTLADEVVAPLTTVAQQQGSIDIFSEEGINLHLLNPFLQTLAGAEATTATLSTSLDQLPTPHDEQLAQAVERTRDTVSQLRGFATSASILMPHTNALLGGEETRNYLVVVLDCDHLRSVGGTPACEAILSVSHGTFILKSFESSGSGLETLPYGETATITDEEESLFGAPLATSPDEMPRVPDASRAAELLADAYTAATDNAVDGVILIDPYGIQSLMNATGSVNVDIPNSSESAKLDGQTTAAYMLHQLARDVSSYAQPEAFAAAANATLGGFFDHLPDAHIDEVASAIGTAVSQDRMSLWLANDDEQDLMRSLDADGTLSNDETQPELGVFLNNETNARIDWYLRPTTTIEADGSTYTVQTTLTNTLSYEGLSELWNSVGGSGVLGYDWRKRSDGDTVTTLYLVAPAGGNIDSLKASTKSETHSEPVFDSTETTYQGHQMIVATVQVDYDETLTLNYTVSCADEAEPLVVVQTPGCKTTE